MDSILDVLVKYPPGVLTELTNKLIIRTANDMNSILVPKKLTFDRFWCRIADPQPPWELSADVESSLMNKPQIALININRNIQNSHYLHPL